MKKLAPALLVLLIIAGFLFAQPSGNGPRRSRFGGGWGRWRGGERYDSYDNPRQASQHGYDENGELRETPN
jgi:hypothetical protein